MVTVYPFDATAAQNTINQVASKLSSYQSALYAQISSSFSAATPVQVSGQLLSGTKLLFQAYANFGLPTSLQTNGTLHALLYGNASIPDASAVQSDFAGFSTSPISNITDNKLTDEISLLNSRSTALSTAFNDALSQIQQSGVPDSLAQVDATLADLQAFETLKNANALSACSYQLLSGSSSSGTSGGSVTITVNAVSGCGAIASSGAPWLNVSTTQTGPGQFQVSINVTADPSGSARSGIVIIGDQIYRVFQDTSPTACTYSLTASSASFGVGSSSGTVGVIAGASCTWNATNPQPGWLTITSGDSGSGNGTVNYSLLANASSSSRSAILTIAGLSFTVTQAAAGPSPGATRPAGGSGSTQTFTFTFSDGAGWQNLGVQDVLINNVLDGRQACYVAYVAQSNSLFLVDDGGDAGGPFAGSMQLNGTGSVANGQCTVNGAGSSATGNGNTLTLTLKVSFSAGFAGNKVLYMTARDTGSGNSGWQAMGTWGVPGAAPTGPAVGGMNPARSSALSQTYTFTFTDSNGWQGTGVTDILINSALDGIGACYLAYVPSGATTGSVFLVDDAGDAGGPYAAMVLPGSGTVQNSQCTINGTGSSVTGSGNMLTLNLAITFSSSFAGNRVFYLAARNNTTGNSGWQAVGSVTVP